jgi:hypothetical protein
MVVLMTAVTFLFEDSVALNQAAVLVACRCSALA